MYIPKHCPECGENRKLFVETAQNKIGCQICGMEFKVDVTFDVDNPKVNNDERFLSLYENNEACIKFLKKCGLTINSTFEEVKAALLWGTYGKPRKRSVKWVRLADCSTEHLKAILTTQHQIDSIYRIVIESLLESRTNS